MATVTAGKTFISGETVTPANLNSLGLPTISEIVNADISSSAAIAASKLNLTSIGLSSWQTKNSTYTLSVGDRINADTSSSSFTITLPASPSNYSEVTLADHAGTWKTNNLTVSRNGSNINGLAENLICDVSAKQILLRYEGATIGWRVYA